MARPGTYHVLPVDGIWAVKHEVAERYTSLHGTQAEAYAAAREHAINQSGQVFTHGRDGRIRDESTFRSDPYPPKG